jgi:hypothetical protein
METPKKQNVRNTSSTLKRFSLNEAYLKAQDIMIRAYKNAIKNGLYPNDDE